MYMRALQRNKPPEMVSYLVGGQVRNSSKRFRRRLIALLRCSCALQAHRELRTVEASLSFVASEMRLSARRIQRRLF